jgi:hypothetical protein
LLNEIFVGLAIAGFVALVTFLLSAYLWMYQVKENHLTHIQKGVERTADEAVLTNIKLSELAIREEERHKAEIRAFEDLKTLIRTQGL